MDETERLLVQLEASCDLTDEDKIHQYQDAILKLRNRPSEEILRRMLGCFRDTDAGEVQYELVEASESYPLESYVPIFAQEFSAIVANSQQWHMLLFQSILNTAKAVDLLVEQIPSLNATTRQDIVRVLTSLSQRNSKYRDVLRRVTAVQS